ncbi:MAG TPA: ATP-binding cassette domain-containing protein [Luteibaculaceae bacterium]|nr:ATP-binding cassette domain-containing protein [Luteibaculaceae bacterium]
MIEVKHLYKSFSGVQVLEDISSTFQKGKMNLIIGKSGSGKSVLTKCMVGLLTPDSGEVLYNGVNFHELDFEGKKEIRKKMGMLFQASALFDSKTVLENVMFPLEMFTNKTKSERIDRARFCLERVNIIGKDQLYPSEISGGMQKRVAIARAIAMNPEFLFCDEPNSGLDPQTSIVIDKLISELTEEYNMCTIVITHDMNSVLEVGDNITFIHGGRNIWTGTRTEILSADIKELNDFVYASGFMKEVRSNLIKLR